MKLNKVIFNDNGFRNLKKIEIVISPRLTVIAGHNGIGKSTILGLISNCSELKNFKSLFDKNFKAEFSEIFYLDYYKDCIERDKSPSEAFIEYMHEEDIITKKCTVSAGHKKLILRKNLKKFMVKVPEDNLTEVEKKQLNSENLFIYRPRIIPRTVTKSSESAKIGIPTIYLGMSRMNPIGEFDHEGITISNKKVNESTTDFIYQVFNAIIPFDDANSENKTLITHDFNNSKKQSKVPNFNHPSLNISLGQDSLSSILTALASFYQLKEEYSDYSGGILVIDEVESGLHPIAQRKIIDQLKKYSTILNLQIVMTSHSLTVIKEVLENKSTEKNDGVIYLTDTNLPTLMKNPSYLKIKNDMLLEPYKPDLPSQISLPQKYVYFEDLEAFDLMQGILKSKKITCSYTSFGKELVLVPADLGCSNLMSLSQKSSHFINSLIILDSDTTEEVNKTKCSLIELDNVILLPLKDDSSIYNCLPPDKIAYLYLLEKYINRSDNIEFWHNSTPEWFTTNHYVNFLKNIKVSGQVQNTNDLSSVSKISRKSMKQWYKSNIDTLNAINVFQLWADEHNDACDTFIEMLTKKITSLD